MIFSKNVIAGIHFYRILFFARHIVYLSTERPIHIYIPFVGCQKYTWMNIFRFSYLLIF